MAKIFLSTGVLKFLLQLDNESLMSEMQLQKEEGVTNCVSESRKRFENFPDFEKLEYVI